MPDTTPVPATSRPQEVPLTLTFGDDTSPAAFRAFNTHYTLVKDANLKRGVTVWDTPDYRAAMVRLQLRGSTAVCGATGTAGCTMGGGRHEDFG